MRATIKSEETLMGFSDRDWPYRFEAMGDEAEAKFEETYPDSFIRMGLNRPPFTVAGMPLNIRAMPDYLHQGLRFVEVQGIGADGIKIKVEKLMALNFWDAQLPVHFFIWSRPREAIAELTLKEILDLTGAHGTKGDYDGRKPYLRLTPGVLPWAT